MTPDEASEMGEFLWMCCREATGRGAVVRPLSPSDASGICPLEAAFGSAFKSVPGLPEPLRIALMCGFDGDKRPYQRQDKREAFALGRMFREHALSGEPW